MQMNQLRTERLQPASKLGHMLVDLFFDLRGLPGLIAEMQIHLRLADGRKRNPSGQQRINYSDATPVDGDANERCRGCTKHEQRKSRGVENCFVNRDESWIYSASVIVASSRDTGWYSVSRSIGIRPASRISRSRSLRAMP